MSYLCTSCCGRWSYDGEQTCRRCYKEVQKSSKRLKRENEVLKGKVEFLRFWSPVDDSSQSADVRKNYPDIVLVATCEDKVGDGNSESAVPIPAHKVVLMSRSPVFKAMLENEMEEKASGTIKISDVSYETLFAFVNYLYTGEASLDRRKASELLEIAEKYQVNHLKADCEKFLISNLNWDRAVMNYVFAHRHNATKLREAALSLITDNMGKFIQLEEYKELVRSDSSLVVEIYEAYYAKQVKTAVPAAPAIGTKTPVTPPCTKLFFEGSPWELF